MKFIYALMLAAFPLAAQQGTPRAPDCALPFQFSATLASPSSSYDNRYQGCNIWTLEYSVYNASAVSIGMNSANDNNNTPGSFTAFGSVLTSTTSGAVTVPGYVPWLNVSGTFSFGTGGFVRGTVIGWRPGPDPSSGGGGSTGSNNCATNFGADPSGQVDSTTALQNCINSLAPLATNDGAFVIIPPSTTPNYFYKCTGQLSWGSVLHGKIVIQTGAALQGCGLPLPTPATWVDDQTSSSLSIYGTLNLPYVTTAVYQSYQVCNSSNNCQAIYTGPTGTGAQITNGGFWYASVASIPSSYTATGQTAAIGSSGSPILLYTTTAAPFLQNLEFCQTVVALTAAGGDPGMVQLFLEWTDLNSHAQTTPGPAVGLGTTGVSGTQCFAITPKANTAISFYTTYTSSGSAQYGISGFLKPQ